MASCKRRQFTFSWDDRFRHGLLTGRRMTRNKIDMNISLLRQSIESRRQRVESILQRQRAFSRKTSVGMALLAVQALVIC